MEIDERLIDKLAHYEQTSFEGSVFRVTGRSFDPKAASINGGRWAPRPNGEPGFPVLYSSIERDGALAEVASYLVLQNPMPSKPLVVHELAVTTSKTITLSMEDLKELGVSSEEFGERNYSKTQAIGTAINYMGIDGLISPSARWECDNLTLFMNHHALEERLDVLNSEELDWRIWARDAGLVLKDSD